MNVSSRSFYSSVVLSAILTLLRTTDFGTLAFIRSTSHLPVSSFRQRNVNGSPGHKIDAPTSTTKRASSRVTSRVTITTCLSAVQVNTRNPNQEEAVELGIREWPQQTKRGCWTESIEGNDATATLIRYVLDGKGTLEIMPTNTDDSPKSKTEVLKVGPGTMVEITGGPASLLWKTTPLESEMVVLTPGFEQLGQLVGVAGGLVVLCIVLFVGLG